MFTNYRKFLKKQVAKKLQLLKRVDRLTEKESLLFRRSDEVKRFVAIQQLRERYRKQLRELTFSLEALAENISKENNDNSEE